MNNDKFAMNVFSFSKTNFPSVEETARQNHVLKRNKIYWISQFTGWFLFAFASIIVNSTVENTVESFSPQSIEIWILLALFGILFTHIYRSIIKKQRWLDIPLNKIIPRVLLSSLIIGILMFGILLLSHLLIAGADLESMQTSILIGIINLSSIILLWSLIYFSVHYFESYKKAEIESYIWEAAVKDFELKTLKSQLNPHFMFNALNSIRALIKENPHDAQNAVTKLSNILRYSLKMEKTETVSFEDEMKAVCDYLSLEKMRFEERLKYSFSNSEDCLGIEIPPMMIQTLVENGIKHGISKMTSGGEISISAKVINAKLHINIKNTGNIDPDLLKNSKGFGINNTKHRLNLLYGQKASFTIKNEPENTVTAKIIIPTEGVRNEGFNNR